MNALIEFLFISGFGFFLFMFLGYKDAIRKKAPSGPLAALFNYIKFWKYEDEKGIRGYLFRQNIVVKLLVAIIGVAFLRILYALVFDFSSATGTLDIFTGASGFLLNVALVLMAIFLSYLWPKVTNKVVELKDDSIKQEGERTRKINERKEEVEEPAEKNKEVTNEVKNVEKPVEKPKKNSDDIINDYLN